MKSPALLLVCAFAYTALSGADAIDFQLKELNVTAGEGTCTDFYFPHEKNRIFYRPPGDWRLEQSAGRFTGRATAPLSGVMTLETAAANTKLPPPGTNTPEALAEYEKLALSGFDTQLQQPKVIGCAAEAMGGGALPCTRVTIDYADQVLTRRKTICYVQFRPELTLLVRIDSLKQDAKFHTSALHSLEAFTEVQGK